MSIARDHAEWLSLLDISGPFLSMPVLLRAFPHGLDAPDADLRRTLRPVYEEWQNSTGGLEPNRKIHDAWVEWVLRNLLDMPEAALRRAHGDDLSAFAVTMAEHGETLRPDWAIVEPTKGAAVARPHMLVQVLPPRQDLEKPLAKARWQATPAVRMMTLLHATDVRLGLVTNGEQWMLVDAPKGETTGFISWYAQLWLDEPLTLRAFRSLLGVHRFFGVAENVTIERLLADSANDQQEVTDQLGYQVRRAVEVLVQAIDLADQDRGRTLLADVSEVRLYEAALTMMMRLVFLLSAEERDLLLLGDPIYDQHYAVSTLRMQLREVADQHGEELLERRYDAWCRLLATFRAVYGGFQHDRLMLPAYGGSLFDPDRFPFLEGRTATTTWRTTIADPLPVNNRTVLHLLQALQILQVKVPGGGPAEARRLSFRALDIEQIGHVYEGLLDHTAKRATEPVLGLVGSRDHEPELPLATLEREQAKGEASFIAFLQEQTGRSANALRNAWKAALDMELASRLRAACGNDDALYARVVPFAGLVRSDSYGHPMVIPAGSVYVTAGTERRATGTHYTPRSLTEPIVQYTLEPLVYHGPAEGLPGDQWRLHSAATLLDLKICDMAMGSGAFLVQTCRYLSERVVEAWEAEGSRKDAKAQKEEDGEPDYLAAYLPPTIDYRPSTADPAERLAVARRLVADRCLYGVDKNPLAVEMAKLSLWLITLDKGRAFTFLDHALKCGDSLLGVNVEQLQHWSLDQAETRQMPLIRQQVAEALGMAQGLRRRIREKPVLDVRDADIKVQWLRQVDEAMVLMQLGGDLLIASAVAPGKNKESPRNTREEFSLLLATSEDKRVGKFTIEGTRPGHEAFTDLRAKADAVLHGRHPFHWPLEFPEVFVDTDTPGFAAVVGNPPFQGGKKISGALGSHYRDYLVEHIAAGKPGNADLCSYFFLRARQLTRFNGDLGLLATNTIAQGETREVGLDQLIADSCVITRAIPSRKWPGVANLEVAHVWLRHGTWSGVYSLNEIPVPGITASLTAPSLAAGTPYPLVASSGKAFQGSNLRGIGFVVSEQEAHAVITKNPRNREVLFPYLNGMDLNSRPDQSPSRWVINFFDWERDRAETYKEPFAIVREEVLPERMKIVHEGTRKKGTEYFWRYDSQGKELYTAISGLSRVLVRARVSNINSVAFAPSGIVYSDACVVFVSDRYGCFVLLQAAPHTEWLTRYSSSMRTDVRYTPSDCFDTYPLLDNTDALDEVGECYYVYRSQIMLSRQEGLTKTYNRFHTPAENASDIAKLRELHVEMDQAVIAAYGWNDLDLGHGFYETKQGIRYTINDVARREVLDRLLLLNHERYAEEVKAGLHAKKAAKGKAKAKKVPDEQMDLNQLMG